MATSTRIRHWPLLVTIAALVACSGDSTERRPLDTEDTLATDSGDTVGDTADDTNDDVLDTTDPADTVDTTPPTPSVPGVLTPPSGGNADAYDIGTGLDETTADATGAFMLPVSDQGVSYVFAAPVDGDGENVLIAVVSNATPDGLPASIAISPQTTAEALVLTHPDLMTRNPFKVAIVLAVAKADPKVAILAQAIDTHYATLLHPFAEPIADTPAFDATVAFQTAYDDAVASVGAAVYIQLPSFGASLGVNGPPTVQRTVWDTFQQIQVSAANPDTTPWDRRLAFNADPGLPLESLVTVTQVDLDSSNHQWKRCKTFADCRLAADGECQNTDATFAITHAGQLDALRIVTGTQVSGSCFPELATLDTDDGGIEARTLAASHSFFSYLDLGAWTASLVDAIGSKIGSTLDITGFGEVQLPADEGGTPLPGAYLVRSVNSRLVSGPDFGEFAYLYDRYPSEFGVAIAINLTQLALDVVSIVKPDVQECANAIFEPMFSGGITLVDNLVISGWDGLGAGILEFGWVLAKGGITAGLECLQRAGAKKAARAGARTLGALLGRLAIIGTVAKVGQITDRVTAIFGASAIPAFGLFYSPMDHTLVVVGDPFEPSITQVAGVAVDPTDLAVVDAPGPVMIGGTRLLTPNGSAKTYRWRDAHGFHPANVMGTPSVAAGVHTVTLTLPNTVAGELRLEVQHEGRTSLLGPIAVRRPVLQRASPRAVFAAAEGSLVSLRGAGFVTADHALVLDGQTFPIATRGVGDRATTTLGAGITPADYPLTLRWRDGEPDLVSATEKLAVLGAPDITAIQPVTSEAATKEIFGNDVLVIEGLSFGDARGLVSASLAIGADTVPLRVLSLRFGDNLAGTLGVRVPSPDKLGAPGVDAALTVRTPGGEDTWRNLRYATVPNDTESRVIWATPERWDDIVDILNGDSFPQGTMQATADGGSCTNVPASGGWLCLENAPTVPCDPGGSEGFMISRPPGRQGVGGCTGRPGLATWDGVQPALVTDNVTWGLASGVVDLSVVTRKTLSGPGIVMSFVSFEGGGLTITAPGSGGANNIVFGIGTSFKKGTGTMVTLDGAAGVQFIDVTFEGESTDACDVGLHIKDSQDVVVAKGAFRNCKTPILIENSHNIVIDDGFVADYTEAGVRITGADSHEIQVGDYTKSPSGVGNAIPGFSVGARPPIGAAGPWEAGTGQTNGVVIDGGASAVSLHLATVTGHSGAGVRIGDASDITVGVGACGFHFDAGAGLAILAGPGSGNNHCIRLAPSLGGLSAPASRVTVVDSRMLNNAVGIGVEQGVDVTISGSALGHLNPMDLGGPLPGLDAGNAVGLVVTPATVGVTLPAIERLTVTKNHFAANESFGVRVTGGDADVTFLENAFGLTPPPPLGSDMPYGAPNATCGVEVGTGGSGVQLTRNTFVSEVSGVCLRAASQVRMVENTLLASDAFAVRITDSHSVTMRGDEIFDSGDSGIFATGSDCLDLAALTIIGNGNHGIHLTGEPDVACGPIQVHATEVEDSVIPGAPRAGKFAALQPPPVPGGAGPGASAVATVIKDNAGDGVSIDGRAAPVDLDRVVLVGNGGAGLFIEEPGGRVRLTRSLVGLDPAGVADANAVGVVIEAGDPEDPAVHIGLPGAGNVIGGNAGGVVIDGGRTWVQGNFIGTDPAGAVARPQTVGVEAAGPDLLVVGGAALAAANLISGNEVGVQLEGAAGDTRVDIEGNFVGTDLTGNNPLANTVAGVAVANAAAGPSGVHIGSNLVSANGSGTAENAGIAIGTSASVRLDGNRIGLGADPAKAPLGNQGFGVVIGDSAQVTVDANTVAHNLRSGLLVDDGAGVRIRQNTVTSHVEAGLTVTGGTTDSVVVGNTISQNAVGVDVSGLSLRNRILGNAISANTGKGIALSGGGNAGLSPPVTRFKTSTTQAGSTFWHIGGAVPSGTADGSRVEIFADDDDEGETFLAAASVFEGQFLVQRVSTPLNLATKAIHATLTDLDGNTSEFGPFDASFVPACDPPRAKDAEVSAAFLTDVVAVRDGALIRHGVGGAAMSTVIPTDATNPAVCGPLIAYERTTGAVGIYELEGGSEVLLVAGGSEPDYSPDCASLVAVVDGDIVVVERGTSAMTAVTDDDVPDASPGFVGPGRVVWSRLEPGAVDTALFHAVAGLGSPTLWVDGPGDEQRPRLSAGGDKVVYTRCNAAGEGICEVVLATTDGTSTGALRAPGCTRRDADWYVAPDGTDMLVFSQQAAVPAGAPASDLWHVVLTGLRGTVFWAITPLDSEDTTPACCVVDAP